MAVYVYILFSNCKYLRNRINKYILKLSVEVICTKFFDVSTVNDCRNIKG